ncbi:hypothetical protein [Nostoc sp. DedQUE05]|uniref:hypothetical protein n=1 Tax=Nostoc sp. DedQUE05 TaxID=3075391 RepID=UPI002AD30828|nr:hypothetical protein [Nostoc sp. DedQUE05]
MVCKKIMYEYITKIIVYTVDIAIIITVFFASSNSAFANDYLGQVLANEYNYKTTNKELYDEQFSTKTGDLLIFTDNELLIKERIELLKRISANTNYHIEIGEYSCYVELSLGSLSTTIYYNYPQNANVDKFTFSIYTPTHGMRTLNLESNKSSESSETMALNSICNKSSNSVYKIIYLEKRIDNKIGELREKLNIQKPVENPVLELNIQNNWHF